MEDRLKQRLIGAAVVVALAVIFIPELLKDPEEPNAPVANLEMPSRPAQTIIHRDKTVSLPSVTEPSTDSVTGLTAAPDSPADLTPGSAAESLPRESMPQLMQSDNDGAATQNSPSPVTTATSPPDKLMADGPAADATSPSAAAADAKNRAASASGSATADETAPEAAPSEPKVDESNSSNTGVGESVAGLPDAARLPPGVSRPDPTPPPVQSRDQAVSEQKATPPIDLPQIQLIGRSQEDPAMDTVSPATSPTEITMLQEGSWMVQAGSFSQEENANDLRDRLISQGFDAFVQPSDSQGQTLYRVRIGPQSTRAQGESTVARLRALGFEGQVVSLN